MKKIFMSRFLDQIQPRFPTVNFMKDRTKILIDNDKLFIISRMGIADVDS